MASNALGYAYDFENHLIQQGGISMVYDGDGNRVSKTVAGLTTTYMVDPFSMTGYAQVVYESFSDVGTGDRELTHAYVYGLERISERRYHSSGGQNVTSNAYYVYGGYDVTGFFCLVHSFDRA